MKDELVFYRLDELADHVEVRIDEKRETIWLTQQQIADLFGTKRPAITKHLSTIFYSGELDEEVVCSILEHTTLHGALRQKTQKTRVKYYSLDAVLAVGYRVNSGRATQFRIWVTRILKDYLLKGYVINNRMNRLEDRMEAIDAQVNHLELQLNTHLIPTQGIFFEGQVFDAYVLVSKIIGSAQKSIVLIDNYVDESVLVHLSKRHDKVSVTLLTKTISKQLQLDVHKANAQYPPIQVKLFGQSHDRFLIIDQTEIYHLGASLKDLGKKWFAFSKLDQRSVPSMLASISEKLEIG
jgi:prophage antirepressor-like protein